MRCTATTKPEYTTNLWRVEQSTVSRNCYFVSTVCCHFCKRCITGCIHLGWKRYLNWINPEKLRFTSSCQPARLLSADCRSGLASSTRLRDADCPSRRSVRESRPRGLSPRSEEPSNAPLPTV